MNIADSEPNEAGRPLLRVSCDRQTTAEAILARAAAARAAHTSLVLALCAQRSSRKMSRNTWSLVLLCGLGSLTFACNASPEDTPNAGGAGGSAGTACPLPPSALIPASCVACIKTSCPSVYANLCAADCGAHEYGPACLAAQNEIASCISTNTPCPFACMRSHGSAYVGGAPGVGGDSASGGDATSGGDAATQDDGGAAAVGAAGSDQ